MARRKLDIYQDAFQNALRNPWTAAGNASQRFSNNFSGFQGGGGSNFFNAAAAALRPQTAMAASPGGGGGFGPNITMDQALQQGQQLKQSTDAGIAATLAAMQASRDAAESLGQVQSPGPLGSGGGAAQATGPQYVQLENGQVFDVSTPQGRIAFFEAKNALIEQTLGSQVDLFRQRQESEFERASREYARALGDFDLQEQDLRSELDDYNLQTERQLQDTGEAYGLGTVRRQNMFAQASPLAYQSSQGTSQQYAQNQYNQALGDIERAQQQTQQNFTRQEADLSRGREDTRRGYNDFLNQARQGIEQYRKSLADQYATQRTSLAGELASVDVDQGIKDFRYGGIQEPASLNRLTADISQYTPFLDAGSLESSPEYNYFKNFKGNMANQLKPVEQFLGYSPKKKQKDSVNSYLRG